MKLLLSVIIWTISINVAFAQYWFGPKIGGLRTDHIYQESTYKTDSFKVKPDYNYQFGIIFEYTADSRYSVHTEINYEHIEKDLQNKIGSLVRSSMNMSYLTVPLMLRVSMGHQPVHWYLNGGPKLSFWLGGSGDIYESTFDEFGGQRKYKIKFAQRKANENPDKFKPVVDGNRIQYGLALGAGNYLDLAIGGRLNFDFIYTFGHSNMGFNRNPDFIIGDYVENFKYRNFTLSASIGYTLEYNAQLQRKGGSTIKRK